MKFVPFDAIIKNMYNNNLINSLGIFGAKYLFIVILGIAFIYFIKQPRIKQKEMITFGIIALPIMYVILKLLALLYFDPRPFVVDHFTPLISHDPDNGFPSDHALLSGAAASIVYPYSKQIGLVLWMLTLLVGASRVYTGVHHPVDVLGSMGIAIIVASLTYYLLLPKMKANRFYTNLWPGSKKS